MRSDYRQILENALREYSEIVKSFKDLEHKIRIFLVDQSYIDVYLGGPKFPGRFSFHWERRHLNGKFYRYDNFPNTRWKKLKTFPYHFHNGTQSRVVEPKFRKKILDGFRDFLEFIKGLIEKQ